MNQETTIRTYTGKSINLLNFREKDVDINDIAHALSNICRFTGHVRDFYSVAQHSLLVSHLVGGSPRMRMLGLLHDASEAYLGDVSSPLKHSGYMDDYILLEHHVEETIFGAMGIVFNSDDVSLIKHYDGRALGLERNNYLPGSVHSYHMTEPLFPPLTPKLAETKFLREFRRLSDCLNASSSTLRPTACSRT